MTTHDAVTDSHEPSYYEIALTNRQVLVAFVVLLVCLLGAFFYDREMPDGSFRVVSVPVGG